MSIEDGASIPTGDEMLTWLFALLTDYASQMDPDG